MTVAAESRVSFLELVAIMLVFGGLVVYVVIALKRRDRDEEQISDKTRSGST
jgi:hypothetical protein